MDIANLIVDRWLYKFSVFLSFGFYTIYNLGNR
jgi:hypothetical protein